MNTLPNLPSPKDLAKKNSTRMISLRVKEDTFLAFEKYAKQYEITTSALINNLLDAYVESLTLTSEQSFKATFTIMSDNLIKAANRIKEGDEETLADGLYRKTKEYTDGAMPASELLKTIKEIEAGKETDLEPSLPIFNDGMENSDYLLISCGNDIAQIFQYKDSGSIDMFIPAKNWLAVATILETYREQFERLKQENMELQLTKKALEKIVQVINKYGHDSPNMMIDNIVAILMETFAELLEAGN